MTTDNQLHGEEAIIQQYLAPLAAGYPGAFSLKDDCAAFTPTPGHDLVVKTDPVAAGIHFLPDDAPEHVAWKALAVNVSDLAAKAAMPRAYLMALSFPEPPTRDWMRRFADGLADAQATFGMHLIGGDTDRRPGPITISITVFGEVPTGTMVRRGTARPGDLIYVSGTLGDAAVGLRLRTDPALGTRLGLSDADVAYLIGRYLRPSPALALRSALQKHARAAMDLSDGLMKDLGRMCRASGVGAIVNASELPKSLAARRAFSADPSLLTGCISAGDDYEVLMAAPEPEGAGMLRLAEEAGVALTPIGRMTTELEVAIRNPDGTTLNLDRSGWDHF